jgi:hypothetical protein
MPAPVSSVADETGAGNLLTSVARILSIQLSVTLVPSTNPNSYFAVDRSGDAL